MTFAWLRLGRAGPALAWPGLSSGLSCSLSSDGPVLALVLSAAPSWLCRLCLCKKFVYCLLSRALATRERGGMEGVGLSSSMAVLLLLFLELK